MNTESIIRRSRRAYSQSRKAADQGFQNAARIYKAAGFEWAKVTCIIGNGASAIEVADAVSSVEELENEARRNPR